MRGCGRKGELCTKRMSGQQQAAATVQYIGSSDKFNAKD